MSLDRKIMNRKFFLMKTNIRLILLFLFFQGICYAGFAQSGLGTNPCNGGDPNPVEEPISNPDWNNWVEKDISSEAPADPNEIIGLEGYDVAGSVDTFRWVSAAQSLAYTIYFENDAELAMAAASKVAITVPLHEKLNYAILGKGRRLILWA